MQKNSRNISWSIFSKRTVSLCLSAAVLLSLSNCSKKEETIQKEVIRPAMISTVQGGAAGQTRKYPGRVEALDRVEVSFEVSGKLIALPVKAGKSIKKGAIIARIDPQDFQNKLEASQAKVKQAKAELDRYANLLKDQVVAKSDYDVKKRNYDVAASNVKISKKALSRTNLTAPFSGRVGQVFVDNFQVIQAKQAIIALQKEGAIDIIINVPEMVMASVKKNEKLELYTEFKALPGKRYPVKLKEFATEADSQTQTYKVVLSMATPKGVNILDGMTATVFHIAKQTGGKGIEVPVQAIFSDENSLSYLWVVGPELQVLRRQVTPGTLRGGKIAITSGLESGERIVTAGVQNLTEGQKIREFTGTVGE